MTSAMLIHSRLMDLRENGKFPYSCSEYYCLLRGFVFLSSELFCTSIGSCEIQDFCFYKCVWVYVRVYGERKIRRRVSKDGARLCIDPVVVVDNFGENALLCCSLSPLKSLSMRLTRAAFNT